MHLEKTEVMWIGEQEVDLHEAVNRNTDKQVGSCMYLCGTVCDGGGISKGVHKILQAG